MANPVLINDALHTAGAVTSAQDARTSLASVVVHDGAGARTGIFYEGTQTLVTGTATTSPSMQVSVSPLAFCGQKAATEGVYIGRSPGAVLVDVAAAPASNSRIDVVYVMQRDANSTTSPDGVTQGEIGVITGTAAASPTKPAIPVGAVEIGTVTVAAGVTATTNAGCTIATTCQWTVSAGASIPVRNTTERGALTAYTGLQCLRLDKGGLEQVYDGATWRGQRTHAGFYSTGTLDGSGYATITHGAGFTPVAVSATWSGVALQLLTDTFTSTTFRVREINSDGTVGVTSQSFSAVLYEAET